MRFRINFCAASPPFTLRKLSEKGTAPGQSTSAGGAGFLDANEFVDRFFS